MIQINPQDAVAYLNRGLAYYQIFKISRGKEDLNKAAELFLEQGNTESYQGVRNLLLKLREFDKIKKPARGKASNPKGL